MRNTSGRNRLANRKTALKIMIAVERKYVKNNFKMNSRYPGCVAQLVRALS